MLSFLIGYALGVATEPVAAPIVKTVAKQIVKGGIIVGDGVMAATKNVREGWSDVVHSAKSELHAKGRATKARTA